MAYAGQTLENPQSGERIRFLKTTADTNGEYLLFDLELQPDGRVPGKHVHPKQTERFTVLAQNAGEDLPFAAGSPAFLGWEARHSVLLRE